MAATDMRKAGLEIGCKVVITGEQHAHINKTGVVGHPAPTFGSAVHVVLDDDSMTIANKAQVERNYGDAQAARQKRIDILLDKFPGEGVPESTDTIERWCAIQWDKRNEVYFHIYSDDADELRDQLGDEILEGWLPSAIYDLDTGESIELHVSTPVVTVAEEQGMMANPLRPEEPRDTLRESITEADR